MKIGLVSPFSLSYFGGVQKHVLALAREFKKLGLEAKILAPRHDPKENYGPDVLLLGYSFLFPANASRIDVSWGVPWETEKILKKEKFDLLHFHGLSPILGWQIFAAGKKLNVPVAYTSHSNVDRSGLLKNFPVFLEVSVEYIRENFGGIISVSRAAQRLFGNYRGPRAIIPNGVDLKVFRSKGPKINRFDDGKINLLFVGRLDERKGIFVLLEAFEKLSKRFKDLRLLVVGEGPLEGKVRQFLGRRSLSEVVLLGKVPEAELPGYYRSADIFCAPSLGGESFGLVLLEAMACGVPVVASRIEGYKEVLKGVGSKLLFKTNDAGDLVRMLTRLIESEEQRRKYSQSGLREVKKYAWEKIAARVLKFYERL